MAPTDRIDARRFAPATARNRDPILEVLRRILPRPGRVLEIASGTGEHAVYFAARLPEVEWQPSDPDASSRASIDAWITESGVKNVHPAIPLDVMAGVWPIDAADAVVCINMVHISPWAATEALLRGAARILPPDAPLYLYGPYRVGGAHTAPSNAAFDADLRSRNPAWGVRDLEAIQQAGLACELQFMEAVAMPANNFSVIFRRMGGSTEV